MPLLFRRDLAVPIPLRDGMRVLEIGTGNGETAADVALWFREAGQRAEIVGIDRDPCNREKFERTATSAGVGAMTRFVVANAHCLPPLGFFDMVLCVGCFSQIVFVDVPELSVAPTNAPQASQSLELVQSVCGRLLDHWRASLAPAGAIVIFDFERDASDDAHARGLALFEDTKWPLVGLSLLRVALANAGFDDIHARTKPILTCAGREEALRSLGPEPKKPAMPALPRSWAPASRQGPHALSVFVAQARRHR